MPWRDVCSVVARRPGTPSPRAHVLHVRGSQCASLACVWPFSLCVRRQCVHHLKPFAGQTILYDVGSHGYGGQANYMPFGGAMNSMTAATTGGMADVYLMGRTNWILDRRAIAEQVKLDEILEDLTPYIATGLAETPTLPKSSYEFSKTLPLIHNVFTKSGTNIIGLPVGYDAMHLVHRSEMDLPTYSDGTAVSWAEYIEVLRGEFKDRDGDSAPPRRNGP